MNKWPILFCLLFLPSIAFANPYCTQIATEVAKAVRQGTSKYVFLSRTENHLKRSGYTRDVVAMGMAATEKIATVAYDNRHEKPETVRKVALNACLAALPNGQLIM